MLTSNRHCVLFFFFFGVWRLWNPLKTLNVPFWMFRPAGRYYNNIIILCVCDNPWFRITYEHPAWLSSAYWTLVYEPPVNLGGWWINRMPRFIILVSETTQIKGKVNTIKISDKNIVFNDDHPLEIVYQLQVSYSMVLYVRLKLLFFKID